MTYAIRRSDERGAGDHGWLNTKYSFSFADYYDPNFMGYKSLRVINEDRVAGGAGFPTHGHKNMEIITYVIEGALEHKDSMGNGSIIKPGEVQYMSAGTGVRHSEYNPEKESSLHLLQIWIMPNELSQEPRYDQKQYSKEKKLNQLCLVVSNDGSANSIAIRQDAKVFASVLEAGKSLSYNIEKDRGVWIQLIKGSLSINEQKLSTGDAIAIEQTSSVSIYADDESEFLLFDLI